MLSIGDIIKITVNQNYGNQLLQNVFFYRMTALPEQDDYPDYYEFIAARFNAVVGIPMRALQATATLHTVYNVKNLTDGIDFFDKVFNVGGNQEPPFATSFLAVNFILRRSTGVTRNGSKRLGGLSESATEGNAITLPAVPLAAFEAALAADLVTSDAVPVPFAEPVIVGRKIEINDEGEEVYVLDLTKINPISSAGATAASTQRTRKLGRGL